MFYCGECGYKSIKWVGKCPLCQGWETFIRESDSPQKEIGSKSPPCLLRDVEKKGIKRISTGLDELNRILGGGLVEGEIILVGGPPGVGKSTLLLDVARRLTTKGKTLYVSAEESTRQIAIRAQRLGEKTFENVYIAGEDNAENVFEYIKQENFKFVIIDSIQVVHISSCEGAKGSVSQIRGCADYFTRIAKAMDVIIFLVGHVTKDGVIAGPKLLEHIVDSVLYFEGESLSNYRILRSIKNRFGPTGDIAVFEMKSSGLVEVKKITDIFLPHKDESLPGSCVICAIEGLRPILIELQSLVSKASFGTVRRRSLGFDFNRFSLLVAIIEKRIKISLSSQDIFLSVAGGLKINDPAADLGAVMAIISSFKDKSNPQSMVSIGEVGLAGEIRRVNNINLRLKEVERGNFEFCIIPKSNLKEVDKRFKFKIRGFSSLKDVINEVFK